MAPGLVVPISRNEITFIPPLRGLGSVARMLDKIPSNSIAPMANKKTRRNHSEGRAQAEKRPKPRVPMIAIVWRLFICLTKLQ